MRLSTLLWLTFACCCALMATLLLAFNQYSANVAALEALNTRQQAAHALVDQLKENRVRLSALTHRYLINHDRQAYSQYHELLDVINGQRPRTLATLTPYLSTTSEKVAQQYVGLYISDFELLKKQGFTAKELSLLEEAFRLFEEITAQELMAFSQKKGNIVQQQQAIALIFSESYQDGLTGMLDFLRGYQTFYQHRINRQYHDIESSIDSLFILVASIIIATIVALLFLSLIFRDRLARPLIQLNKQTRQYFQNIESFSELTTSSSIHEVKQLSLGIDTIFKQIRSQIEHLNDDAQIREQLKRQAEQSSVAKSQFIANTNHEVRTPLNAIIGFNNLMLATTLDNEQQHYLNNAQEAAQSLLTLFDDVAELSSMDEEQAPLALKPCNIENIAKYLNALIAQTCRERYLTLQVKIAPDCPVHFQTDEGKLKQILTTIAKNALKYTKIGGLVISICPDNDKQQIKFSVQDTGIGIAPEQIAQILTPFEQAELSPAHQYSRIGIGLTLTRKLCQRLSGQLSIVSTVNQGSTFTVALPLAHPASRKISQYRNEPVPNIQVLCANSDTHYQLNQMLKTLAIFQSEQLLSIDQALNQTHEPHTVLFVEQQVIEPLNQTAFEQLSQSYQQICVIHEQYQPLSTVPYTLDNIHTLAAPFLPSQLARIFNLCHEASLAKPQTKVSWDQFNLAGMRVLLVEDALMNQLIAQKTLENFNVTVDIAENGEIALQKLKYSSYDLILMDLHMPVMDGFSTIQALKTLPDKCHIPVIGLTADVQPSTKYKCLALGMLDVLTKPFDPIQLASQLSQIRAMQLKAKSLSVESGSPLTV